MTSKSMTFRFPALLAQAIETQARATGKDRTTVVAEALGQAFGLSLPSKMPVTIEMLQQRLETVESSMTLLSEQLSSLQKMTCTDTSTVYRLELLEQFSHSLRALLATSLGEASISLLPQTIVEISQRSQRTDSSQQALEPGRLQLAARLEPQTDLRERILATMSAPVFVCDRSRRLLYINPMGVRSLGLEPHNALQQTIQAFALPPETTAQLTVQFETVFLTGQSLTSEISFTTSLHGMREYEYTLSPIQGTVDHIEAVLFSTQEITERKQVEAALQASAAKYQHLFESTNDAILILDALTRRILDANTNASRQLGYTRQELCKLSLDEVAPLWGTEVLSELSQRLRLHGKSFFEHVLRHKDGTDIPIELSSRLIEYGDRLAIQSFIRDLSEATHHDVSLH
ncbi:MAG: PAS domain S-box protein [Tildeniella nuda ZEHNDER 1965/U140]|nr:PAS domain S-box protein [Tildeniella nuda ZEHNDER 1965/U140]